MGGGGMGGGGMGGGMGEWKRGREEGGCGGGGGGEEGEREERFGSRGGGGSPVLKKMCIEDPGEERGRGSAWTRVGLGVSSPSEAPLRSGNLFRSGKDMGGMGLSMGMGGGGGGMLDLHYSNPAACARSMSFHEM